MVGLVLEQVESINGVGPTSKAVEFRRLTLVPTLFQITKCNRAWISAVAEMGHQLLCNCISNLLLDADLVASLEMV